MWKHSSLIRTKMAEEDVLNKRVFELRKEVQTLRDTEAKLKSHQVCCQKAKEWFLNKKLKFMDDQPVKEGCMIDASNECKSDMQFCEILALLSEIKREQKRLLMLKHQLHSSQMQEEVGLLNDVLLKQSVLFTSAQGHAKCAAHSENDSPLAMWFAEISQSISKSPAEKMKEKFTDSSNLFYNVCYTDTKQPRDLLVEKIYKRKSKRDQRKKDVLKECLKFSTCHRGYCVQVAISLSNNTRHGEEGSGILDPSYHIHFDVHLNDARERLLEYLVSRKPLEDFVRQFVWKEIEKLPTEVLVTLIATLDIGHVAVTKCEAEKGELNENGSDVNNETLAEDKTQENISADKDKPNEGPTIEKDDNDTPVIEPEDDGNENNSKHHDTNLDTNENSERHESRTNAQSIDPTKPKRSESASSKVSNVSSKVHSSTLSGKVSYLEENLKRLQNIVGSLITQVDPNNTVIASIPGQLGQAENNLPNRIADIHADFSKLRERSTSMGLGHEQLGGHTILDSSHTIENMSEILAEKRPVTQPVLASANRKPVLPRSKTAGFSVKKEKRLSRQSSMPLKLKPRQFAPTIPEEVQHVVGEQGAHGIKEVTCGNMQDEGSKHGIEDITEEKEDTRDETWDGQQNEEYLPSESESEEDIEEAIQQEIDAALSGTCDPQNTAYALRLGLDQMQRWRKEFQAAQDNVRLEIEECKNYIQSMAEHMNFLKTERKNQETEQFNALHNVHRQILDLEQKQTKLGKTVNELVDEYNRHETTFSDMLNSIDKLDEQKVDKVLLSSQVNDKANKDELRDKVSVSTFDESFTLLDQALNDALEKMANQMSVEEALRETLNEMQSGMELKLNREDMENLKDELEARIKEVRAAQEKGLVGKNEIPKDPAGFKRFMERVRCISCDRDVEIKPSHASSLPSLPKAQPLPAVPRSRDEPVKKFSNDLRRISKLKPDMIQGTGIQDLFPMSQRFCGGRHTITRGNKRYLGPSLNDYIVVRESDHVSLPPREFLVSKDSGLRRMTMKRKLPEINDITHLPGIQEEKFFYKHNNDDIGNCDTEQTTPIEK